MFGVMKSVMGIGITDEDVATEDHSGHGRTVGWAPLDGASAGALEMQGNDGLALTQGPIPDLDTALNYLVHLVTPHRTSSESSLGCSNDHFSFAWVVGE